MSWKSFRKVTNKAYKHIVVNVCLLVCSLFFMPVISADTERVVDYQYDGAGNITRTITQEQSAQPTLLPLDPNFINIGRTISITATGTNLLGVDVTTLATGLSVTDVVSTFTQVTFRLTASNITPEGNALLDFTTGLGVIQATIFVAEAAPTLTTSPSPIAIAQGGSATNVVLSFSEPRPENETYQVVIGDAGVATGPSTFNILTGETQVVLALTGIADGTTSLDITLASKFYFYSFPIFVGKSFAEMLIEFPDMKLRNLFTEHVGVMVQSTTESPENANFSSFVGVTVGERDTLFTVPIGVKVEDTGFNNPALSASVGINVEGTGINNLVLSPAVGVKVEDSGINNPALSDAIGVHVGSNTNYSSMVGTSVGPIIDTMSPSVATAGNTTLFSFTGLNLAEVQTVSTIPGTDIIIGTTTVNGAGTLLTVDLIINGGATLGQREIKLQDASGDVFNRTGSTLSFDIQ